MAMPAIMLGFFVVSFLLWLLLHTILHVCKETHREQIQQAMPAPLLRCMDVVWMIIRWLCQCYFSSDDTSESKTPQQQPPGPLQLMDRVAVRRMALKFVDGFSMFMLVGYLYICKMAMQPLDCTLTEAGYWTLDAVGVVGTCCHINSCCFQQC